jgi:hypothetical protein
VPNVIMLNVRANRAWTANNNAILAARDTPNDNIILIDWARRTVERVPGQLLRRRRHPPHRRRAAYYADLIGDWTGR